MAGRQRHTMSEPGSPGRAAGVVDVRQLRALLPMTPRVILRALLGMFLFFGGIVLGAWLLFRFRRHLQDATP